MKKIQTSQITISENEKSESWYHLIPVESVIKRVIQQVFGKDGMKRLGQFIFPATGVSFTFCTGKHEDS